MSVSFQEIINSRLFKFIVGETSDGVPTEFSVHEEAIAQLSKPLHSLMKGGLSEAQAGCAIWKDVSKETFEPFVQFAYTGDYSIPKTEKRNTAVKLERVESNSLTNRPSSSTSSRIRTWNKAEEVNEVLDIEESKVYEEEKAEEASFDSDDGTIFCRGKKVKKKMGKIQLTFVAETVVLRFIVKINS